MSKQPFLGSQGSGSKQERICSQVYPSRTKNIAGKSRYMQFHLNIRIVLFESNTNTLQAICASTTSGMYPFDLRASSLLVDEGPAAKGHSALAPLQPPPSLPSLLLHLPATNSEARCSKLQKSLISLTNLSLISLFTFWNATLNA